jgi:hypothetical protein
MQSTSVAFTYLSHVYAGECLRTYSRYTLRFDIALGFLTGLSTKLDLETENLVFRAIESWGG